MPTSSMIAIYDLNTFGRSTRPNWSNEMIRGMDAMMDFFREMNIGNVIVSLGGSLIVAYVSLRSIRATNDNARKLKDYDYRRVELDSAADAIEASRAMVERIVSATELLQSRSKARNREAIRISERLTSLQQEMRSERSAMERLLLRVIITNPHDLVRRSARLIDESISKCLDSSLPVAMKSKRSGRASEKLKSDLVLAKDSFATFRETVHETYHHGTSMHGSIRKSAMSKEDREIKAARAEKRKREEEAEELQTKGGSDDQPA